MSVRQLYLRLQKLQSKSERNQKEIMFLVPIAKMKILGEEVESEVQKKVMKKEK
jgi:hypothetical protein